jgi:zinc transport system permease protein
MVFNFITAALLGGIGVALLAGPLGCFIVWRRMAYFGDTLSHSALLGVALAFWWHLEPTLMVIITSVLMALLLVWLQRGQLLAVDTLLGILAHSALAFGMVVLALLQGIRIDLMGYLFGDILAINTIDLMLIYGGGSMILLILCYFWRQFLAMTVHEELAAVEGLAVARLRLILMILVALVIAVAMKVVGLLLITALLIIPAATARHFAKTPEQMAVLASGCGCVAVLLGVTLSILIDIPTGPAVVVVSALLFMITQLIPKLN